AAQASGRRHGASALGHLAHRTRRTGLMRAVGGPGRPVRLRGTARPMSAPSSGGVLVVGSLTVDLTAASERLPAAGETVLGTGFTQVAGGKGANQALAAARMGAPTWMVGRVGDDAFREIVFAALADAGVRADFVTTTPDVATGIAHIRVDARGDNDIVMVPLANAAL